MKIKSLAALAATAFVMSATLANASTYTIDFDGPFLGNSSYTEDGFTVTGVLLTEERRFGTPKSSIRANNPTQMSTITRNGGGSFALLSFDHLCLLTGGIGCPNTFTVTGQIAGGGSTGPVSISSADSWQTASPAGFSNLSSFSISVEGGQPHAFDTIRLADVTPVPVLPSLGFLATGLAGFAALRRRRRS
jgi:hypothetical protein